ncbi:MAG: fibronectin type III domain-containing protein [Thermoplasmata archaeon]|nr:MAG: fibronectin type III domain-containing protein [Thermoplasmata archaeon]
MVKRAFFTVSIVLCLFLVGVSGFFSYVSESSAPQLYSTSKILYVGGDGSGNYSTISAAISAASSGDTIFVFAGTYIESFTMKSNVDLIGEDENKTIINANESWQAVWGASNAVIKGFTIKNFRVDGIRCNKITNLLVKNMIIICDHPKQCPNGITSLGSQVKVDKTDIVAPISASTGIGTDTGSNNVAVKNTIIYGNFNQGFFVQGGVYNSSYNNFLCTSFPERSYYGKVKKGTGDISKDPKFVCWSRTVANLDLHLATGSPCIDTGDPNDPVPEGGGKRIDMGAFENMVKPAITVPGAPENLSAKAGKLNITLTWSPPKNNGGSPITGYKIYRGLTSNNLSLLAAVGNVINYIDKNISRDKIYYYAVSAQNKVGEGPLSNIVNATSFALPSAPRNLKAHPGDSYVNLSWKAPASNGGFPIKNYRIYKGTTASKLNFYLEIGNVLFYNDTSVTNGIYYYYKVTAKTKAGEGPFSNNVKAKPAGKPTKPLNLSAQAGSAYVNLSWSAPASDGGSPIANYRIYKGTTLEGVKFYTELGVVLLYQDTDVSSNVKYFYRVSAKNSVGEGPLSDCVNITLSSSEPVPPQPVPEPEPEPEPELVPEPEDPENGQGDGLHDEVPDSNLNDSHSEKEEENDIDTEPEEESSQPDKVPAAQPELETESPATVGMTDPNEPIEESGEDAPNSEEEYDDFSTSSDATNSKSNKSVITNGTTVLIVLIILFFVLVYLYVLRIYNKTGTK